MWRHYILKTLSTDTHGHTLSTDTTDNRPLELSEPSFTFCCGPVTPSIALALFQNEHLLGTISAILMFHFVPELIGMHPNIG